MKSIILKLWDDDYGVILSTELVIIGTLLTLGMLSGMVCLKTAVTEEMTELGSSFTSLDQSYRFSGVASIRTSVGCNGGCCDGAATSGSFYRDYRRVNVEQGRAVVTENTAVLNAHSSAVIVGGPIVRRDCCAGQHLGGYMRDLKITEYPLSNAAAVSTTIIEPLIESAVIVTNETSASRGVCTGASGCDQMTTVGRATRPWMFQATHREGAGAPFNPAFGTFSNGDLIGLACSPMQSELLIAPGVMPMMSPACPSIPGPAVLIPQTIILQQPCCPKPRCWLFH